MDFTILILFLAGISGGMLNSLAGGGSFLTFPALLFAGVPPISANASNTFASTAGYLSGAYGFRREIKKYKKQLPFYLSLSFIGGMAGSLLLLQTEERVFEQAIPWLLLFATFMFIYGAKLRIFLRKFAPKDRKHPIWYKFLLLGVLFLGIATYGGFFNAGYGIIMLAYLTLAGFKNMNGMNGLKLLTSSTLSLTAIIIFIYNDVIAWVETGFVLIGTLLGGYLATYISRKFSSLAIRRFVILISISITAYFFYDTYGTTKL